MDDKINLAEKLAPARRPVPPRDRRHLNDYKLVVVKARGEFVWHKHDDTDDFFLVLSGRLTIQLRDRDVELAAGELFVVPRGVEHCPKADEEAAGAADRAGGHAQHRRRGRRAHRARAPDLRSARQPELARAAGASTRERQSSLRRMLRTCMSTVRGLRNSSCAISRFVRPTASRRTTSRSRRDKPPPSASAAARAPEPPHDRLAERGDLARRLGGQRPRAELARRAVGVAEALERRLALARGGQRDPGALLDLRALERHVQARCSSTARESCSAAVSVAVEQRDLGDRVRERRERVGVPGLRRDPRQRLGARVRAVAVAPRGEEGGAPADAARPHSGGRRSPPSARGSRGSARPPRRVALRGRDARERRGRVDRHVVVVHARGGGERGGEQPARRAELALEGVDRAEQALGDEDGGAGLRSARGSSRPRATSRPARAARRPCTSRRRPRCRRPGSPRQSSSAVSSASSARR